MLRFVVMALLLGLAACGGRPANADDLNDCTQYCNGHMTPGYFATPQ